MFDYSSSENVYAAVVLSLMVILGWPTVLLIIGFYFVFQFVSFDDNGFKIYFLNHVIKNVKWDDVEGIGYGNSGRLHSISLHLKDGTMVYFDSRRDILKAIGKNLSKKRIYHKWG